MVYMTGIALLAFGLWIHSSWPSFPALTQPEVKNVAGEPWTVWDSSGPYAPPPVWNDTSYESNPLPAGYEVKKVVLVMRHGARYPTVNVKRNILSSLSKLDRLPQGVYNPSSQPHNGSHAANSLVSDYIRWINSTWTPGYLTDVGGYESWIAGQDLYRRYGRLLGREPGHSLLDTKDRQSLIRDKLWLRVNGVERTESTGFFLLQGLLGDPFILNSSIGGGYAPDLVMHNGPEYHNSLHVKNCKGFSVAAGLLELNAYKDVHMPRLLKRLQQLSRENETNDWVSREVSAEDVMSLLSLCGWERAAKRLPMSDMPYDSAVSRSVASAQCPFMAQWLRSGYDDGWCGVFLGLGKKQEQELWETYSYAYDIAKYWGQGPGNPMARTLGDLWVKDTMERLTLTKSVEEIQSRDFRERSVYIDLSHDNDMLRMMHALGIDLSTVTLEKKVSDTDCTSAHGKAESPRPSIRSFAQERLASFGASLVVERVGLIKQNFPLPLRDRVSRSDEMNSVDEQDFVRIFVNHHLVQIDHPACKQLGDRMHGGCRWSGFVGSQKRDGNSWAQHCI